MIFPDAGIGGRLFPSDLAGVPQRLLPGARSRGACPCDGHRRRHARRPLHCRDRDTAASTTRESRSTGSWPASAPSPTSIWPWRPVWRSTTASWSTRSCAPATPTSTRRRRCRLLARAGAAPPRRARGQRQDDGPPRGTGDGGRAGPLRAPPLLLLRHFDLGYEAVGDLDSRLEMVADGRSRTARASSLPPRGPGARRAALERLGPARCRPGADRRSRRDPLAADDANRRSAMIAPGTSRSRSRAQRKQRT